MLIRRRAVRGADSTRVFVWATGQDENIGDSLLRRAYLEHLRVHGGISVWTAQASNDFVAGLGLDPSDRVFTSYRKWYLAALRSAFDARTMVAVNAGEVPLSRRGATRMATLAVLTIWCRLFGGAAVWAGAGVPRPGAWTVLALPYRVVARLCDVVHFRDRESNTSLAVTREVAPDWAFALGSATHEWPSSEERSLLAVVLRGDRERPSPAWIAWVRSTAEALGLEPIVVVQVRRDSGTAAWLATELDGVVSHWGSADHAAREREVRRIYARSAVVVGDRLHGLIVGATEGAVPLGWVESSNGKIRRHFDAIGLDWPGSGEGCAADGLSDVSTADITRMGREMAGAVDDARARLTTVGRTLAGSGR
ncbi:hypothetical protein [Prescottella subtropica]|uniref:hypothetical protein n=1 Tax=Prescottella subtropica TaxID=2545757 RepID=UPI0010F57D0B|nr:hypothetical protein [Prescottella subtropica]